MKKFRIAVIPGDGIGKEVMPEGLRVLEKIMETLGVEEALRRAGVQEGDTVSIGEFQLEWQD